MQRRTQLILLLVIAACALGFGIWFLTEPFLRSNPTEQPGQLPSAIIPSKDVPDPTPIRAGGAPLATPVAPDVKRLQDLAGIVVARVGSGASSEGFQGYTDVMLNATPAYQAVLKQEQAAMKTRHPASGPSFGVMTRVVSIDGKQAISGAATIPFTVQVQHVEDAGDPLHPTLVSYKAALVTFEQQPDKNYLVSGIVWSDIQR